MLVCLARQLEASLEGMHSQGHFLLVLGYVQQPANKLTFHLNFYDYFSTSTTPVRSL